MTLQLGCSRKHRDAVPPEFATISPHWVGAYRTEKRDGRKGPQDRHGEGRDVMRKSWAVTGVAVALVVTGCGPDANKADLGLGVGAIAGGIIGSAAGRGNGRIAGAIIGTVAGGIIGSELGRSMDREDRRLAQRAEYDALDRGRSGAPVHWRNPDNGRYGEVVPAEPYRRGGQDCRDYTHTVYIDGRPQAMRGTACRNPDGTWSGVG